MLTEIAVGSTLLLQALAIATELLPQITELATSVLTLYRTGEELADTVRQIFKVGASPPSASAKPAKPIEVVVPTISPPGVRGESPAEEPQESEPAGPRDIQQKLEALVSTTRKQDALLSGLSSRKPGHEDVAVKAGYEALAQDLERQSQELAGDLAAAFEKGENATLMDFVEGARSSLPASKRGVTAVLSRFMETARFAVLYDASLAQRPELNELKTLEKELARD
jgi:hypothetical protein